MRAFLHGGALALITLAVAALIIWMHPTVWLCARTLDDLNVWCF